MITEAFAQGVTSAPGGATDLLTQLQPFVPFVLIVIIMYFLIIRPQQKTARDHAELVKNVRRGDTVVMTGGLIGKVARVVDDAEIEIEVAPNVKVRVARPMISSIRSKGEPVKDAV